MKKAFSRQSKIVSQTKSMDKDFWEKKKKTEGFSQHDNGKLHQQQQFIVDHKKIDR